MNDLIRTPRATVTPRILFWALLALDAVVSIWCAHQSPIAGWDETVYRTNALFLAGHTDLAYQHHRPPMFPLLQVLFGCSPRWVVALAHITCVGMAFLIVRRVATDWWALLAAVMVFLCSDLRLYNLFMLTEVLSAALLLVLLWGVLAEKPRWAGVCAAALVLTHWQMIVVTPAVVTMMLLTPLRTMLRPFLAGIFMALVPFCLVSQWLYGHPIYPFLANLLLNLAGHTTADGSMTPNDWLYYLRHLPLVHWVLFIAIVVSGLTAMKLYQRDARGACAVKLVGCAIVIALVVPMHLALTKDVRLIVPVVPMALTVFVVWLACDEWHRKVVSSAAAIILVCFTLLNVQRANLIWTVEDLKANPTNVFAELPLPSGGDVSTETVFTDLNDLAATAHYARYAIPVLSADARHHRLYDRKAVYRRGIPNGAIYVTWNPDTSDVIAETRTPRGKRIYLVRWRQEKTVADYSTSQPSPSM